MRAVHLVHRHFEFFERVVLVAPLQRPLHDLVREAVLLGKAIGRDGLQARQKTLVDRVLSLDRRKRVIGQAIVVAIIAIGRCALRMQAQVGLILLLEQRVLGGEAQFDGLRRRAHAGTGAGAHTGPENEAK
jgi:hypothetical protein